MVHHTPASVRGDDAQTIGRELLSQYDLSIFDIEILHRQTKAIIAEASGHPASLQYISLLHMGDSVGSFHERAFPHSSGRQRGRPPKPLHEKFAKRARNDAWNEYVRAHPPAVPKAEQAAYIKSGQHLQKLGTAWNKVRKNPVQLQKWRDVAFLGQQLALQASDLQRQAIKDAKKERARRAQAIKDERELPAHEPHSWYFGIGSSASPLRAELLMKPERDEDSLSAFRDNHGKKIELTPVVPEHVAYDDCCSCQLCCLEPLFDETVLLFKNFWRIFVPNILEVFFSMTPTSLFSTSASWQPSRKSLGSLSF